MIVWGDKAIKKRRKGRLENEMIKKKKGGIKIKRMSR